MKKVKIIGPGRKLNNEWRYDGDVAIITEEEYEKNKEGLEVLEEIESLEDKKRTITLEIEDENIDLDELKTAIEEFIKDYNKTPENFVQKNPTDDNSKDDEELNELREKAKNLGIKNVHSMKKETLIQKISEAENENE
ncbi:MAG: Rho termination factor N-terminal domain-containing protein [Clostridia bacterium]|nr:Rho termination factor N-terminal domain-containing protein [Clostridia bacterium]